MSRPPGRLTPSGPALPVFAGLAGAVVTLAGIALLFAATGFWIYRGSGPRAHHGQTTTVVLRRGAGLAEIGADLQRAGVIRSAPLFMAAAQLTGSARRIRAGEYAFPSRASLADVLRRMRFGLIVHHRITIPEGFSSEQAMGVLARSDVLAGSAPAPAEGALLPETYEVVRGETRAALVKRMMDDRDRLLAVLWAHRQPGLPFADAIQAVTLASIIEKETSLAAERPHVAAVYINRLRQGMKLEADPTVIYGVTRGAGPLGHALRASELAEPTPYNTYVNTGLPPTPIDNPGRASLAAVLDPSPSPDLYFVADGSGGHVFSSTLAQHLKNVARWRVFEKAHAEHQALAGAPLPPGGLKAPAAPAFAPIEHR